MIHEFVLQNTKRNISTGLISDLRFDVITSTEVENKWDDAFVGKYSISTPGSIDDVGFIAYNSLTSSDLLGFINKYGDISDNTNGLVYYQTLNSSSFATNIELKLTTEDLPSGVDSNPITI